MCHVLTNQPIKVLMSPAKAASPRGLIKQYKCQVLECVLKAIGVGNLHFPLCILKEGPILDLIYDKFV